MKNDITLAAHSDDTIVLSDCYCYRYFYCNGKNNLLQDNKRVDYKADETVYGG